MLGDLGQGWVQAVNVHSFIAHIAYNNFVLVGVLPALFAGFTLWALPRESFDQISVKRRMVAASVINLAALAALKGLRLINSCDPFVAHYAHFLISLFVLF